MGREPPSIHGRDHLPGGADPIWKPDQLPAILAANLVTGEQHLQVTSTTVTTLATVDMAWSHYDGDALLDLSTPTLPVIVDAGMYAVTASVVISGGGSATTADGFEVVLEALQVSPAWPPGSPNSAPTTVTFPNDGIPIVSICMSDTSKMVAAADGWKLSVFNRSGFSVDVTAGISVVKIFQL